MQEQISTKKKAEKVQEDRAEMTFWEHLEELRKHLIRSFAAIILLAIVAFLNRHLIFDRIILAPKDSEFITHRLLCKLADIISFNRLCIDRYDVNIININLSGQFLSHMYTSIMAGIVVAAPYVIWEMWRFIQPALYDKEKKHSSNAVLVSSSLFIMGILFSYFVIVPLTINFLGTYHVSEMVQNQISLKSYVSTVVSVTLAVGLVFELPILIYFLSKVGIVTPEFLKKNRKVMIVIVLVMSAIITPPDVFSQILVSIPLILLYEASIGISRRVQRKNQKARATSSTSNAYQDEAKT